MKRILSILPYILLSCFLSLNFYHANTDTPRVSAQNLCPETVRDNGPVLLEGGYITYDDQGQAAYHLNFHWTGTGYFYLPNSSRVLINGQAPQRYASARNAFYELPPTSDNVYTISILSSDSQTSTYQQALYLGSFSQINHFVSVSIGCNYFIRGLCLAVSVFSFFLFLWKRSERYLLWLALLACFAGSYSLLSDILGLFLHSPRLDFLLDGRGYRILNETLIALFQFNIIKHLHSVKIPLKSYLYFLLIGCLPAFLLYQHAIYFTIAIYYFYLILYVFFVYFMLQPSKHSLLENHLFWFAWFTTVTARFFNFCCELDIVPYGNVDLQLRFRGIISVIYVIAFFLIACKRFAQKFQEADDLNVHLEEEIRKKSLQQTTFIRSMLHNLKTPLFSLSGYSDMAMKTIDTQPATAKQYIQRTHEKAIYAGHMMDQIFFVTQMESGLVKFQQIPLNLADILHSVIETSQLQASQKHIRLTLKSPDIMTTCGDPLYLQQAFQNIVDNALIHTPENGHILVLGIQEKDRWRLLFTDNGCGIAPEEHSKIFDAYYSNRPDKSRSSGLGLYITKEIITHHQGTITVESLPDSGTTFVILLPKADIITSATN